MNIIEAYKSGRRFKRQDEKDFYELADMPDARGNIPLEDAVAEDYILEPEAKLLTREQIKGLLDYPTTYLHESGVVVINEKRFMAELDELFKETE